MRIIVIPIISFLSFFPLMTFTTEAMGLSDDGGAITSGILGWVILPIILLSLWKEKPNPEVLPIDKDDPIMEEHIFIARSEIARLLQGLEAGEEEAFIKFPYEFDGETEHVWGVAHEYRNNQFIVTLASEPVGEISEQQTSRIKIHESDLEDWMLVNSRGKTRGGYTMLAMAKIYNRDYGKLPKRYAKDLERFTDFKWKENA